eukprot:1140566-Pelagomonas_calceolata.AAC.6
MLASVQRPKCLRDAPAAWNAYKLFMLTHVSWPTCFPDAWLMLTQRRRWLVCNGLSAFTAWEENEVPHQGCACSEEHPITLTRHAARHACRLWRRRRRCAGGS